jgi:hypothetical protein
LLRHPAQVRAAGRRGLEYIEAGVGAAAGTPAWSSD